MVEIKFSKDNNKIKLFLDGHAGQADIGQDIVCASASILAYTVAQIVTDAYEERKLKRKPMVELEKGKAVIVCEPKDEYYAEMLYAYFVSQVGYNLLSCNYPQYIKLTMFNN